MEFHQLEYLVTVVDEASFTSAASKLRVSQPTVSAQIRRLEQELGVQLLDRSARTITPTDAGREILPYARASLQARESARDAASEFAGLQRGRVTIGVVPPPLDFLAELLADFHEAHPYIDITLHEAISDRLVAALLDGTLDVAITSFPAVPPEGLRHFTVVTAPIVALVRSDDDLAERTSVPLASLRGRRLICHPAGSGIRSVFESACAAAGFAPRIAFETGSAERIAQLVARGLGTAVAQTYEHPPAVRSLAIADPELHGNLVLAWRAQGHLSPAAKAWIARTRQHFRVRAGSS